MGKQKFEQSVIDEALARYVAGEKKSEICRHYGITNALLRFWARRAGVERLDQVRHTDETKVAAVASVAAGETLAATAAAFSVDEGTIRNWTDAAGVCVPNRVVKYTGAQRLAVAEMRARSCRVKDIVAATGVAAGSVCAILAEKGIKVDRKKTAHRKLSDADLADMLRMRSEEHRPVAAIADEVGVSASYAKTLLLQAGALLPQEAVMANVAAGRAAMSPEVRAAVVAAMHTPEAKAKRVASYLQTMDEDPTRFRGPRSVNALRALGKHLTQGARYRETATKNGGVYLGEEQAMTATKQPWRCAKGHVFEALCGNVVFGQWCPRCVKRTSKPEQEIADYIRSILPDAEVLQNDRTQIGRKELDVWVPSHRFAVEYNGLFWHSTAAGSRRRSDKELAKFRACEEAGIRLLMVFQDEYARSPDLVKAMIRHRLGVSPGRVLDARKLVLEAIQPSTEVAAFFDGNHLAGATGFSYGYGLRQDAVLVAAATVRVPYADKTVKAELARFAVDRDIQIRGAAGRLVAAIRKQGEPALLSYSDNRLSTGDVYRRLGFVACGDVVPRRFYTDGAVRLTRRQLQVPGESTKTFDERAEAGELSARHFGDRRPLYRIEDAGHRKWRLDFSPE